MISLTVWIQYTSVTDGQTDRHSPTAIPRSRIAPRGN